MRNILTLTLVVFVLSIVVTMPVSADCQSLPFCEQDGEMVAKVYFDTPLEERFDLILEMTCLPSVETVLGMMKKGEISKEEAGELGSDIVCHAADLTSQDCVNLLQLEMLEVDKKICREMVVSSAK